VLTSRDLIVNRNGNAHFNSLIAYLIYLWNILAWYWGIIHLRSKGRTFVANAEVCGRRSLRFIVSDDSRKSQGYMNRMEWDGPSFVSSPTNFLPGNDNIITYCQAKVHNTGCLACNSLICYNFKYCSSKRCINDIDLITNLSNSMSLSLQTCWNTLRLFFLANSFADHTDRLWRDYLETIL